MNQDDYYYNEHDVNQVKKILKQKKKKKMKRRMKILFILFVMALIGFYCVSDLSKVHQIKVTGNSEVSDKEIIDSISINENTYYLLIDKDKVAQEVKDVGLIKKAVVSVSFIGDVTISVEEADKVAYCEIGKVTYVIDETGGIKETEDESLIQSLQTCPKLTGFKDVEFLKTFAKQYVLISDLIKNQTSDIVYSPKKADETRLKFVMDNGKILYLRVEDMVEQLASIDYEAFMTLYKDKCEFRFEGKMVYYEPCK